MAATTKKPKTALNVALAFVRGPFFLMSISLVLLLAILPAQATLLRGYLKADDAAPASDGVQAQQNPEPGQVGPTESDGRASGGVAQDVAGPQPQDESEKAPYTPQYAAMDQSTISAQKALVTANSFPLSFAGAWKCVSVVVASAVNTVPVGERLESEVDFVRQSDGRVMARWEQPGWTEAQTSVTTMSDREAAMERTNYYLEEGMNGGWAAKSRDHYLQIDPNRMTATSFVDQYIDGQFLGRYRTTSMLYRVGGNVAYAHK